jgi:hypothetical protein
LVVRYLYGATPISSGGGVFDNSAGVLPLEIETELAATLVADTAPVITGAPSIIGTPTVGVAVSYTPASVTGSPAPARTQQWAIGGVDIVGATNPTYTPVAGNIGASLTVRQIETNIAGTDNETSAGVTVVAASSATIAITTGTSNLALTGAYTNAAPASIEIEFYAENGLTILIPWAVVPGAIISDGTWSGTVSVTQSGMYRFAVRSKNGAGTVLATSTVSTNAWGVGDLFNVSVESIAAAVLAAAAITPIAADIKRVNAVTLTGAGVSGNSMRPA